MAEAKPATLFDLGPAQVRTGDPYRPSNGTEGDIFISQWCANCACFGGEEEDDPDAPAREPCPILGDTMALEIDDPEYPKEWIYAESVDDLDEDGKPICTAFVERLDSDHYVHPEQSDRDRARWSKIKRDPETGKPVL